MKRLMMVAGLLLAGTAHAQVSGLDELLKQVQQGSAQEAKLNAEREQRFLRHKGEQAALLQKAESDLAAMQARSSAIKSRYEGGQKSITDLKARLQDKSADYTQVYAVVKQVAGDFRGIAAESLVGAQLPQRLDFLDQMAQQQEIPSIAQLEKLWFTMQQEMTENGKVVRFKGRLLDEAGIPREAEIVRIGAFTAISEGRYLALQNGALAMPARQPKSAYLSLAEPFAEEKTGLHPVMVDPSRGSLLLLEAERPSMMDRIHQGEEIGYVIIFIGVVGFLLAMFQTGYLFVVNRKVQQQLTQLDQPLNDNPLGRVLATLRNTHAPDPNSDATDAEVLELRLSEAVLRETPKLDRFQGFIRLVVAAGPLLGLVGTVGGMIITFQVITELGAGDPKAMARGISQAMIATLLGLGIAIPLLFINAYLSSRSKALIQILDEQSAGMLSRSLESRKSNAA